eukprot:Clim_evm2s174 gene=Clim_evmTU2s174
MAPSCDMSSPSCNPYYDFGHLTVYNSLNHINLLLQWEHVEPVMWTTWQPSLYPEAHSIASQQYQSFRMEVPEMKCSGIQSMSLTLETPAPQEMTVNFEFFRNSAQACMVRVASVDNPTGSVAVWGYPYTNSQQSNPNSQPNVALVICDVSSYEKGQCPHPKYSKQPAIHHVAGIANAKTGIDNSTDLAKFTIYNDVPVHGSSTNPNMMVWFENPSFGKLFNPPLNETVTIESGNHMTFCLNDGTWACDQEEILYVHNGPYVTEFVITAKRNEQGVCVPYFTETPRNWGPYTVLVSQQEPLHDTASHWNQIGICPASYFDAHNTCPGIPQSFPNPSDPQNILSMAGPYMHVAQ